MKWLRCHANLILFCRHEEMSNAIIFYINAWTAFELPPGHQPPDMGTVTVSRRGVVNVRLGWHNGVEWEGNSEWTGLVDKIRDFLLTLCCTYHGWLGFSGRSSLLSLRTSVISSARLCISSLSSDLRAIWLSA